MSLHTMFFAFGPRDSFYISNGQTSRGYNLPSKLSNLLKNDPRAVPNKVLSLCLFHDDGYFLATTGVRSWQNCPIHIDAPDQVLYIGYEWVYPDQRGHCPRYMIQRSDRITSHGLSRAFLETCYTYAFGGLDFCNIGHNSTWFIKPSKGSMRYKCINPTVEKLFRTGKQVKRAYLSPYSDKECFVQYEDGSTAWVLPKSWHATIKEAVENSNNSDLLLPASPTNTARSSSLLDDKPKKINPLIDLIETEQMYVDLLKGIIRQADVWARSSLPPPELDTMFRCIESIYKANRPFFMKLGEICRTPSSSKALEDLLMQWIHDLKGPYTSYYTKYCTGFDSWGPVQSNEQLQFDLATLSAKNPPPLSSEISIWTLDALFLLPKTRIKYYRKFYGWLLTITSPERREYELMMRATETLDKLMGSKGPIQVKPGHMDVVLLPPHSRNCAVGIGPAPYVKVADASCRRDDHPGKTENPENLARQSVDHRDDHLIEPDLAKLTISEDNSEDKTAPSRYTKQLREALNDVIISDKPNVKWNDVGGLSNAKASLKEAVILPIMHPSLFKGKLKAWKGILLYGPPGTGKSYLAKAVATESESTFCSVSVGDLVSKWQGESGKIMKELFHIARARKPSVIFIDEIDSVARKRGSDRLRSEGSREVLTELLTQMDGVGRDDKGVLVLAATNEPWSLDPAIIRRLQKRIYIPMPDKEARIQIFNFHIGSTKTVFDESHLHQLAEKTEGFSGSDIANVVNDAIYQPLRAMMAATHFKKIGHDLAHYLTPCHPSDIAAIKMTWEQAEKDRIVVSPVTSDDFLRSLSNCKPTVAEADIHRHEEWTKEYGIDGV